MIQENENLKLYFHTSIQSQKSQTHIKSSLEHFKLRIGLEWSIPEV